MTACFFKISELSWLTKKSKTLKKDDQWLREFTLKFKCLPQLLIYDRLDFTEMLPLNASLALTIHLFMKRFSQTGSHFVLMFHAEISMHSNSFST